MNSCPRTARQHALNSSFVGLAPSPSHNAGTSLRRHLLADMCRKYRLSADGVNQIRRQQHSLDTCAFKQSFFSTAAYHSLYVCRAVCMRETLNLWVSMALELFPAQDITSERQLTRFQHLVRHQEIVARHQEISFCLINGA